MTILREFWMKFRIYNAILYKACKNLGNYKHRIGYQYQLVSELKINIAYCMSKFPKPFPLVLDNGMSKTLQFLSFIQIFYLLRQLITSVLNNPNKPLLKQLNKTPPGYFSG